MQGGHFGSAPPVGFIDLDDLVELVAGTLTGNFRNTLADIASNHRSARLAQALAAAASGGPLTFVPNVVIGGAGGALLPGTSYTLADYTAAASAANLAFLRSFSLWPRTFPVFLSRPIAILAGPWAVGGTIAGNAIVRQFGPAGDNDSLALIIARGLFLDGSPLSEPLIPEYGPHVLLLGDGAGGMNGVIVQAFRDSIRLTPFWEKDP